jgi:hypothetical protein
MMNRYEHETKNIQTTEGNIALSKIPKNQRMAKTWENVRAADVQSALPRIEFRPWPERRIDIYIDPCIKYLRIFQVGIIIKLTNPTIIQGSTRAAENLLTSKLIGVPNLRCCMSSEHTIAFHDINSQAEWHLKYYINRHMLQNFCKNARRISWQANNTMSQVSSISIIR